MSGEGGWGSGWDNQAVVQALTVIVQSGIPGAGMFVYNGAPGLGNPPVWWVVAPGVTKDPYGNTVTSVMGAGSPGGSHLQVDQAGNISLIDATPVTRLYETPGNGAIVCYDPTGQALGHQLVSVVANAFTDPAGNTIQRGVTAYGLSNPATQYAQLVGANLSFFDTTNDATSAAIIGLTTVTTADDALALQSPLSAASDIQSSVFIQRAATPGPAHVIVANADLNVRTNATPAQPASGFSLHSDASGFPRVRPSASGDTNDYDVGHFTAFSTSDQTVSSTTFATVCGSAAVAAAKYRVRAVLICQQGATAAANDYRLGFTGTISQVRMTARFCQIAAGTGESVFSATTTSNNGLLSTSASFAISAFYTAEFDGIIVTTSSGTLSIQAAEHTAGDPFTVLALSFFHLEPVN